MTIAHPPYLPVLSSIHPSSSPLPSPHLPSYQLPTMPGHTLSSHLISPGSSGGNLQRQEIKQQMPQAPNRSKSSLSRGHFWAYCSGTAPYAAYKIHVPTRLSKRAAVRVRVRLRADRAWERHSVTFSTRVRAKNILTITLPDLT
ncbi:uncharacterized protein CLUP02_03300 [Colletotrichum lupini]|uniref:Uncharacterized protein n=1 Tax=Colletotrichum lupini TaxID=145971 RepID=A0A9Q8WC18_9PEZI|nr:uncharacterized protein CLUP02_03300 [Colletotrichum lupini]UQC77829.1 hypothetical protein CLUP02_03300 [Colletotrichum lupini]